MAVKAQGDVPEGMQRVYRRFERWRSSHRGRLPIPARLWASAAAVAREHGVLQTAKVLRLEYAKLKRMVESAPGSGASRLRTLHAQRQILHLLGIAVRQQGHKPRYPIVGIGASAGGFEAFVKASPSDKGLALVLVQHLDPGHQSSLPKLLSKSTTIPVCGSGRRAWRLESIHVNWRLCGTPSDWIVHTLRMSQTINTTTMMVPTNPKPSISLLLRKKRLH